MSWLERASIPVDLGDAVLAGHARVEVERGYETEAREIMRDGPPSGPQIPLMDTSDPVFMRWRFAIALLILLAILFTVLR